MFRWNEPVQLGKIIAANLCPFIPPVISPLWVPQEGDVILQIQRGVYPKGEAIHATQ